MGKYSDIQRELLKEAGYGADNNLQPIPFSNKVELPPFPLDCLPPILRDFTLATAKSIQVPLDMVGAGILAVIAACTLGAWHVEGTPDWREPTNLYMLIIAPPAERKSAILRELSNPIITTEQTINSDRRAAIARSASQLKVLERRVADLQIQTAKNPATEPELIAAEKELMNFTPVRPVRYLADDCTPEMLISLMAENHGRMAVFSAEGGIFDILNGRYNKGMVNIDAWLKGHAGDMIRVDRRGRPPENIDNPRLTALLFAQPEVLTSILSNRTFAGRGLLARFLIVQPKSIMGYRQYQTPPIPDTVQQNYSNLCRKIITAASTIACPDAPWPEEKILYLSPAAFELSKGYSYKIEVRLLEEDGNDLSRATGKLHGAVLRIAALLHLAQSFGNNNYTTQIEEDTFQRAIELGEYFHAHAEAAYTNADKNNHITQAQYILKRIYEQDKDELSRRELFRLCQKKFSTVREMQPFIEILTDMGYLEETFTPPITNGGRSSISYIINKNIG